MVVVCHQSDSEGSVTCCVCRNPAELHVTFRWHTGGQSMVTGDYCHECKDEINRNMQASIFAGYATIAYERLKGNTDGHAESRTAV